MGRSLVTLSVTAFWKQFSEWASVEKNIYDPSCPRFGNTFFTLFTWGDLHVHCPQFETVFNWLIRNYSAMRLIYLSVRRNAGLHSLLICILFQREYEWLLWMWKLMCSPPSSDLLVPLESFWLCFVTPGTPTLWSRPELERFLSRPYFSSRGMSTRASWWTLMEQVFHTNMLLFKWEHFCYGD